ncbi:hypothetical protein RB595_003920 [Gaeumannomyces hyphopodioides]
MATKYTIRRGGPEDVPALWSIADAAFKSDTDAYWTRLWRGAANAEELAAAAGPWWIAWQRREMATPGKHFWVAAAMRDDAEGEEEEELVGFVSWQQPLSDVDPDAGKTDADKAAEQAAVRATWPPCIDPSVLDVRRAEHLKVMRREIGESWRAMWVTQIIAVNPNHQRKGLATMLMRQGLDKAEESGAEALLVATPAGRKTYTTLGFKDVCGYRLPFDEYDVWIMRWKGAREA